MTLSEAVGVLFDARERAISEEIEDITMWSMTVSAGGSVFRLEVPEELFHIDASECEVNQLIVGYVALQLDIIYAPALVSN